ncbi:MAG: hypothetical protein RI975_1073, partial [Pseudomonadota bacterium]
MHCVDLANALDGAGLEDLSGFAQELAGQFKQNQAQSLLLVNDFVALTNAGVTQIHPGEATHLVVTDEVLNAAKTSFANKLAQLKAGKPISAEPIAVASQPAQAEQNTAPAATQTKPAEEVVEDAFPNQEFSPELFRALQTKKAEAVDQPSAQAPNQTQVQAQTQSPEQTTAPVSPEPISREQAL